MAFLTFDLPRTTVQHYR